MNDVDPGGVGNEGANRGAIAPAGEQTLYARVVRPPWLAWDGATYCGARLLGADETSLTELAAMSGIVRVVMQCNFVAVVAHSDAQAAIGARRLRLRWSRPKPVAARQSGDRAPVQQTSAILFERGDVDAAFENADAPIERIYAWPSVPAPSAAVSTWALAWHGERELTVWLPRPAVAASNPQHALRTELAALLNLPAGAIMLIGTDNTNDAAADAALLSQIVRRPVQVTLAASDRQGNAAGGKDGEEIDRTLYLVSRIEGAFDAGKKLTAYRYSAAASPSAAPALALLLTGVAVAIDDVAMPPALQAGGMLPYAYPNVRIAEDVGTTAAHASPAPPASLAAIEKARIDAAVFAHESFATEAALQAGVDPVAFRLRHLDDGRGAQLIARVAQQGEWRQQSSVASAKMEPDGLMRGRGFAYAHVIENHAGKTEQSWSAWIADVAYDSDSGDISISRVVVGQDAAQSDHPADAGKASGSTITQQLEGDAVDAARLLLHNAPSFDAWGSNNTEAAPGGALSIAPASGTLPASQRAAGAELGPPATQLAGGAAFSLPAAAAVANAIYDATGVRLREPPFSGERIRLALAANAGTAAKSYKKWLAAGAAAATALIGVVTLALPWRAPIAPVAPPDPALYSAAAITRGKLVAAAGDCVVCHTAPNGIKNTGGLALDTPFGIIYSTNITPDVETGIGNWSYAAFERAMREGIHRDGKHLYPAFPYTAFAKTSDADLQALYAYLMAQEPVKVDLPKTKLAFPFNVRPLMAGWNLLFHSSDVYKPDPSQSVEWNRGAYLAEGLGHCGACHTPRNAMGAEKGPRAYLTGGMAEGWEAPALSSLSKAPIPWTETDLFDYLRTGFSPLHGVAAGPMGPVVEEMAQLPESDVKAIAHYIASFGKPSVAALPAAQAIPAVQETQAALAARIERDNALSARALSGNGKNIYEGACAVCHQTDLGPALFGVKPSLALNTNLYSATPDNLARVILNGINTPAHQELGYMPGFRDSFDDSQIDDLVGYLRARFAAKQPAWKNVSETIAKLRAEPVH